MGCPGSTLGAYGVPWGHAGVQMVCPGSTLGCIWGVLGARVGAYGVPWDLGDPVSAVCGAGSPCAGWRETLACGCWAPSARRALYTQHLGSFFFPRVVNSRVTASRPQMLCTPPSSPGTPDTPHLAPNASRMRHWKPQGHRGRVRMGEQRLSSGAPYAPQRTRHCTPDASSPTNPAAPTATHPPTGVGGSGEAT